MKILPISFGILMLLAGLSLLISPEIIIDYIENNQENTSLYIFAIVVRLIIGISFIVGAKESKYPGVIKFFGYLFIIAAIIFTFMGQDNFQHIISSLVSTLKPYAPVSGLLGMAFGGFIVYAFTKKKN